jgi:hypothetical protein
MKFRVFWDVAKCSLVKSGPTFQKGLLLPL